MTDGQKPSVRWTQSESRCARQPRRGPSTGLLFKSMRRAADVALAAGSGPTCDVGHEFVPEGTTKGGGLRVGSTTEGSAKEEHTRIRAGSSNRVQRAHATDCTGVALRATSAKFTQRKRG